MQRSLALLLTAVLLLGACGGKDKKNIAASDKGSTTTASKTATTKKGGGGSSGGAGPQPATPAGVKATAPGSYTYKVKGTMTVGAAPQPVDTTATMKVDPLQGTDQHSSLSGQQGGTETVLRYQGDGVYLVDLKLTGAVSKEFKPTPPALAFPQPATVGKTWSWSATSTDGKTTVKSDFKVLRTETIAVGGEQVPTVVLDATVTTDGDVKSTSHRTIWTSEAYRLIVRQDDKINGTYGGFAFSGDTSSVIQSTKPT
jgi:hypothetical protein